MFDRRKIGVCVFRVGAEEGIGMVSKDQTCSDTKKDFYKGSEEICNREKREERDRVLYECKLYNILLNELRALNLYLYNEYWVLNTLNNNNNRLTTHNREYSCNNRKQLNIVMNTLSSPLKHMVSGTDQKFGTKTLKTWCGKSLCKDISYLVISRDKLKTNVTTNYTFANEVIVYLNMLGAAVENRIRSQGQSTGIVTPHDRSGSEIEAKITNDLAKPGKFQSTSGKGAIFSFCGRMGYRVLFLKQPRDRIIAKKHSDTRSRPPINRVASPISIHKCNESKCTRLKKNIFVKRTLEITQNTFDCNKVSKRRVVHKLANSIDNKGDVRSSERAIL
jgi:hypothetical protein